MSAESKTHMAGRILVRTLVVVVAATNLLVLLFAAAMSLMWNQYNALITFTCMSLVFWVLWFVGDKLIRARVRRRKVWQQVE